MQQTSFSGVGRADDVLEVALGVAGDLLFSKAVAGAGDEHGCVDDEPAEICHGGLESGQDVLAGPLVGREVLGECVL